MITEQLNNNDLLTEYAVKNIEAIDFTRNLQVEKEIDRLIISEFSIQLFLTKIFNIVEISNELDIQSSTSWTSIDNEIKNIKPSYDKFLEIKRYHVYNETQKSYILKVDDYVKNIVSFLNEKQLPYGKKFHSNWYTRSGNELIKLLIEYYKDSSLNFVMLKDMYKFFEKKSIHGWRCAYVDNNNFFISNKFGYPKYRVHIINDSAHCSSKKISDSVLSSVIIFDSNVDDEYLEYLKSKPHLDKIILKPEKKGDEFKIYHAFCELRYSFDCLLNEIIDSRLEKYDSEQLKEARSLTKEIRNNLTHHDKIFSYEFLEKEDKDRISCLEKSLELFFANTPNCFYDSNLHKLHIHYSKLRNLIRKYECTNDLDLYIKKSVSEIKRNNSLYLVSNGKKKSEEWAFGEENLTGITASILRGFYYHKKNIIIRCETPVGSGFSDIKISNGEEPIAIIESKLFKKNSDVKKNTIGGIEQIFNRYSENEVIDNGCDLKLYLLLFCFDKKYINIEDKIEEGIETYAKNNNFSIECINKNENSLTFKLTEKRRVLKDKVRLINLIVINMEIDQKKSKERTNSN